MEGGVQLNARGERFHDQTEGYSEAAVHVLAQSGGVAWDVFDGPILELAHGFPDFCAAEAAGALKICADAQSLAAPIGCATEKIIAMNGLSTLGSGQIDSTNAVKTPQAGTWRPLLPPCYAIKVTGALLHTQGGLDIDARCREQRADAAMIQIEDHGFPKRCGHLDGKSVIPSNEMCGKLCAALDARQSAATLILTRTGALAVEGLGAALERAEAYLACGVDALFIEALRTTEQMDAACSRFAARVPLLANTFP